jgi:hypothetical protein
MGVTRTSWSKGNAPPTAFKRGQSGNPGGKPRSGDAISKARQYTDLAIEALVEALKDPEQRIAAAIAILDRGWGKPPVAVLAQVQSSVVIGGIDGPPQLADGEWEQWLRQRRIDLGLEPPSGPSGREAHLEWEQRRYRELDLLAKSGRPGTLRTICVPRSS